MFVEAFAGVFQIAYVTHDRAVAERELSARLGVSGWSELEVEVAAAQLAVAFAPAGRTVIELIEPRGGDVELFAGMLPTRGVLRLHHLGVRVADRDLALEHAREAGYTAARIGELSGHLRFAFVDTTDDLGHYIELAEFAHDGWDFMSGMLAAGEVTV
jgi:hypothetical protein